MELNKNAYLPGELEQLTTLQLEELLQTELHRAEPDGELVRQLLRILEQRMQEIDQPPLDAEPAWKKYTAGRKKSKRKGLKALTAIAAVFLLVIFVLPQTANANNIVELVTRWSDSFLAFFGQTDIEQTEYVFKTDNPGLQQVYDEVVDMGVTVPVVPMWLEEGYELKEIERATTVEKDKIHTVFQNGQNEIIFTVTLYATETAYMVHKDDPKPAEYECNGIIHDISYNSNVLFANWTRENIVCFMSVDCHEDIYKILESIYTTEAD